MSERKNVIVTGATGAIGKAIAKNIALKPDYFVLIVARNKKKAEAVTGEINRSAKEHCADYFIVDLSRKNQIYALADQWDKPIHVLINNAAAAPRQRMENEEGIELQFATNVLGYFWMMDAFTPHLKKASPSRIVNVASYWAGGLDLSDIEFKKRPYNNDTAYRQSKQANRMISVAFADILKEYNISVNACHPGDVNSGVSNDLGYGGFESPDQGASTPVWLATDQVGMENTGKYFEHLRESSCRFSSDKNAVQELYNICKNY